MSSQRLHGGQGRACLTGPQLLACRPKPSRRGPVPFCKYALITLCLLLSCRLSMALDAGNYTGPANPVSVEPAGMTAPGTPATPAMMALPANVGPLGPDASLHRKFYTI